LATNQQLAKSAAAGFPWNRLWFLLGALVVYRIGAHIPVPGVDPVQLAALFKQQEGGILGMFNMFSGGALSRFTVFALGITPYISASIIIFAGIAAGLPSALGGLFSQVSQGAIGAPSAILIVLLVAAVTYAVVFVERGQRKILVNYAKRQVGNKIYGGQTSHLPLKLNMAGVIPPIFASSIILFPATIVDWFSKGADNSNPVVRFLKDLAASMAPGEPIHALLYAVAIIFFCFFYTALVFNSKETADNLKKSGAFVPGIRPGEQTARYIDKILMRLTLAGAVYITAVCLLPEFMQAQWKVSFYFGGTSLLIIVVVTMDFMAQVQNYVMSQQYESLLRKANFKGGLPTR
jgi:preprotein translocase subunit SecY